MGQAYIPIALVAEDDVILRMNLCEYLRDLGLQVLEAANGEEARKIIDAVEILDVVISDIQMNSPTDGIDLARWLGESHPAIPVILTSGSAGVIASGAWKVGANVSAFVPKPYALDAIEALVRRHAGGRGASSK